LAGETITAGKSFGLYCALKKLARELDLQPEVLKMIILQGFRPAIQAAVIQKGELDMDEMIHVAKLAESVEVASSDATNSKTVRHDEIFGRGGSETSDGITDAFVQGGNDVHKTGR
jgi:hypothetical protein